ncbi:SDR family oxidoreductase [Kitasatospora aureofaciens]|uniref:Oxidoreductase n=1 Tax=Kitasatospora aureofaciens TaxID=1894 RepID=A0A1E7N0N1_KITAU|nr:SDR family oxidoreductase [Kitasatospora aureofaciens]QEU99384.1 SDR family oxidoreductase [Streptomyces viridifaciens]ARF78165.1 oxidoreductase [Kitasatospora aureofaciens]OEV34248.1 oxidoreductase [Kitasatospora aureofaciens]UKZ05455.1 SDR family oxidoreductase [Streptomyces viridifaciens]GGU81311.1 oxidoreductase [Kitasatospora aureofaciens]
MDLGLKNKAYVVTGATRGLGLATARELVAEGAHVLVSGRTQDAVDAAVTELAALGTAHGLVADNAGPDTADRLIAEANERFGRFDGILISVGGPQAGPVETTPESAWRDAFESVFLGALRLARTAAAALPSGGVIGFVLSSSVRQPIPGLGISNGLRPGLAMAAKSLADELGPRGIRVLGLLPGRIDTDRVRELDALAPDPAAARAEAGATIPLRRYGTPQEFGRVAAFLLSPAASYLTGVMVPVDGGALRSL